MKKLFAILVVLLIAVPAIAVITTNMSLDLPVPGVTDGPEWAQKIVDAFEAIDEHDHTTGKGVKVPQSAFTITSDFDFNSNALTSVEYIEFNEQSAAPTGNDRVYVDSAGELHYLDDDGNDTRITLGGSLDAASVGGIGGDYGTGAEVLTYASGSETYTFLGDPVTHPASINAGDVTIREPMVASPNGITIKSPAALAGSYILTLPTASPTSTGFVKTDGSGNLSYAKPLPEDWVSVCATAGSQCDYVGTDETPFNSALTAVGDGGVILVGPGTYTFTTELDITESNVRIVGSGATDTQITGAIASASVILMSGDTNTIENIEVQNTDQTSLSYAINITGDENTVKYSTVRHTSTSSGSTHDNIAIRVAADRSNILYNEVQVFPAGGAGTQKSCITVGDTADANGNLIHGNKLSHSTSGGIAGYGVLLGSSNMTGAGSLLTYNNTVSDNIAVSQMDGFFIYVWAATNAGATAEVSENLIVGNSDAFAGSTNNSLQYAESGGGTNQVLSNIATANFLNNGVTFFGGVVEADNGPAAVRDGNTWGTGGTVTSQDFNGRP